MPFLVIVECWYYYWESSPKLLCSGSAVSPERGDSVLATDATVYLPVNSKRDNQKMERMAVHTVRRRLRGRRITSCSQRKLQALRNMGDHCRDIDCMTQSCGGSRALTSSFLGRYSSVYLVCFWLNAKCCNAITVTR